MSKYRIPGTSPHAEFDSYKMVFVNPVLVGQLTKHHISLITRKGIARRSRKPCLSPQMINSSGPRYHAYEDEADSSLIKIDISGETEKHDAPFLENCPTCHNTGFVPCPKCNAEGFVRNSRSVNVFYCPDCVGHKKLRCPTCGGKCYMCA